MNGMVSFGDVAELVRETVDPREIMVVPYIGLEHIEEGTLRLNGYGHSFEVSSVKFRFKKVTFYFGNCDLIFEK